MTSRRRTAWNQRCVRQRSNLQYSTMLKQRCVFQRWIEQRCHFQCRCSQRWATSKQRCVYDHLKKIKPRFKKNIIFLRFKEYTGLKIFFIFPHFKRNLQNNISRASKILKTSNILNNKNYIYNISLCKMLLGF